VLFYDSLLIALTFKQHLRGNTGIWTKDVTDTDFTTVAVNNNPQVVFENKATYPPVGTPMQAGSPYQPGSPYPQPQAPGLYTQPQAAGSFNQPNGASPYPQV
jgi:hypothetical protein